MIAGIVSLCLAYVLSQFFRSFLAVLTGILGQDTGVTPDDLSTASGLWFLSFALMQIPVGGALDRIGPRLTAAVLFLIGGAGGAALFAVAQSALHVKLAMLLDWDWMFPCFDGVLLYFCACLFPKEYLPQFAANNYWCWVCWAIWLDLFHWFWVVQSYGWRETLWGLAIVSALIAIAAFVFVRNPPKVESAQVGRFSDLLKMPVLWLIIPLVFVNYLHVAALRGLWIGPYLVDTCAWCKCDAGRQCQHDDEPCDYRGNICLWPIGPCVWIAEMGHFCWECDCANCVGCIAIVGRFQFHLGRVPVHRHWLFWHVVPDDCRAWSGIRATAYRGAGCDIDEFVFD